MADKLKQIACLVEVAQQRRSPGFSAGQLHRDHLAGRMDPFLAIDHFEMAEPYFPPHPHAGFSAVTYIFADSATGFVNRDSLGDHSRIPPGALHWTVAGRGVVHEEVPEQRGVVAHGLQLFVNLHSSQKHVEPHVLRLAAEAVPVLALEQGGYVRVVVGSTHGLTSPLAPPTTATLLDVVLVPGERFEHRVPAGENAFVYVVAGEGTLGADGEPTAIARGQAVGFTSAGERVQVRAGAGGLHLVLAGGRPLGEPIVFQGPFCMNTVEQIERARSEHEGGLMGRLEPSF